MSDYLRSLQPREALIRELYYDPKTYNSTSVVLSSRFDILSSRRGYCDKGSEFISKAFQDLMKQHGISHVTADEGDHNKMGMIERFNRTFIAVLATNRQKLELKKWL